MSGRQRKKCTYATRVCMYVCTCTLVYQPLGGTGGAALEGALGGFFGAWLEHPVESEPSALVDEIEGIQELGPLGPASVRVFWVRVRLANSRGHPCEM